MKNILIFLKIIAIIYLSYVLFVFEIKEISVPLMDFILIKFPYLGVLFRILYDVPKLFIIFFIIILLLSIFLKVDEIYFDKRNFQNINKFVFTFIVYISNMLSIGTLLQLLREGIYFGESLKIHRIFEFFMNGSYLLQKKLNIYQDIYLIEVNKLGLNLTKDNVNLIIDINTLKDLYIWEVKRKALLDAVLKVNELKQEKILAELAKQEEVLVHLQEVASNMFYWTYSNIFKITIIAISIFAIYYSYKFITAKFPYIKPFSHESGEKLGLQIKETNKQLQEVNNSLLETKVTLKNVILDSQKVVTILQESNITLDQLQALIVGLTGSVAVLKTNYLELVKEHETIAQQIIDLNTNGLALVDKQILLFKILKIILKLSENTLDLIPVYSETGRQNREALKKIIQNLSMNDDDVGESSLEIKNSKKIFPGDGNILGDKKN